MNRARDLIITLRFSVSEDVSEAELDAIYSKMMDAVPSVELFIGHGDLEVLTSLLLKMARLGTSQATLRKS